MASVELRQVSKVYSGQTSVLDEIDLSVADGELLVVLGPNGSGKTTLLRLIAGLEPVTSGEIWLGGRDVTRLRPRQRDVAMVFQGGVLYPHLTVRQNLEFGQRGRGGVIEKLWSRLTNRVSAAGIDQRSDVPRVPSRQRDSGSGNSKDEGVVDDRVRDTAQLLGIESMLNRLPRQLSGGERQRVALGRALVRQPAVFLLDEPLANADMKLRQELRIAFRRARAQVPGTMILVSHDHTEALALGERIAVLGNGKVQQLGPADEVFRRPRNRFVAEFVGQAGMSFVDGRIGTRDGAKVFESELGWLRVGELPGSAADGRTVSLGWRPSAARVRAADVSVVDRDFSWIGPVEWLESGEEGTTAYVSLPRKGCGDERIVAARLTPPDEFRPGDRVWVEIDWSRAYWFDSQTGNNLAVNE